MITQDLLKELLQYNPETGLFTWRKRDRRHFKSDQSWNRFNTVYAGKLVGSKKTGGYMQTRIFGKIYTLHRLVFLWVNGAFPKNQVDHVNRVTSDNRWSNLRMVSQGENLRNQKKYKNNSSGVTGVTKGVGCAWVARINVDGRLVTLGTYKKKEDAVRARYDANRKYMYHANHGILLPADPGLCQLAEVNRSR